jgi:hypothetical protein
MGVEPWCVATGALLKNESDDEKIAPAVARCRAPRKTGRVLNNVQLLRYKKFTLFLAYRVSGDKPACRGRVRRHRE